MASRAQCMRAFGDNSVGGHGSTMTVDPLADCEAQAGVEPAAVCFKLLDCVAAVFKPAWLLGKLGVPVGCFIEFGIRIVPHAGQHFPSTT